MITAIRRVFIETPEKFEPCQYLGAAYTALIELVTREMRDIGTAGDFVRKSLKDMIEFYKQKDLIDLIITIT